VAGQHLDGAAQVAAVPHLHLAVAPGGDQRERLVRVVVHAPEGDRYTQQCKYCITCSNALHTTEMISPRRRQKHCSVRWLVRGPKLYGEAHSPDRLIVCCAMLIHHLHLSGVHKFQGAPNAHRALLRRMRIPGYAAFLYVGASICVAAASFFTVKIQD
jgi:hypothetical protein